MKHGKCNAVYVVLGEQPEQDHLERCTTADCSQHHVELAWVRRSPERLRLYNEQVARYDLGQRIADLAEQEALL